MSGQGGGEPLKNEVLKCILTWKDKLLDYEIIQIDETSNTYFDFAHELKNNAWFAAVYKRKMYAFMADYIRIKLLYEHGGIYLDTDVSVLKNFDNFLHEKAFVGLQSDGERNRDLLEPAVLGAQAKNPILGKIIKFYEKDIWSLPLFSMPAIFLHCLKQHGCNITPTPKHKQEILKFDDISIYPERFFIPFRFDEKFKFDDVESDTHTIHWFGGSWIKPEILYFLQNKHLYPLKTLETKCKIFALKCRISSMLQNIFSIKNHIEGNKKYKALIVFGAKFVLNNTQKELA